MTVPRLRHLLSIDDLDRPLAERILETARAFEEVGRRPVKKVPTLRGKTIINLFYEASTRTRTSFELAGKRLSADVVNVGGSSSSVSKGETLSDTVRTLDAMHPDVIVVRHAASGAAEYVAARTRASIVNAGDGLHQHPTQALLDAFTILSHKGKLEGLTVAICGDILHSRVARSNARLLPLLGAHVRLAGPTTLLPRDAETLGCPVFERLGGAFFPTLREYSRVYGLNRKRLALARPDAIVMHPGPLNRGVEISDDVADGEHSVILDQVESGVAVRMAVLYMAVNEPEPLPLGAS